MSNMRIEEVIEILRKKLQGIKYPQSFSQENYPYTNSYAYAIGCTLPDKTRRLYYPGGISERPVMYNTRFLLRFIKSDMERLGIFAKEISLEEAQQQEGEEGKQIIAFFFSSLEEDFHFLRKDRDGTWSHKKGDEKKPEKVRYEYEEFFDEYQLIAYLRLSFR